MSLFGQLARNELAWAVGHRRHLHSFPELSFEEEQTSLYCQNIMRELGFEVKVLWKHGFIADFKVSGAKKTIAWRSELDAIAVSEKNRHGYVSKNEGAAHMCGHDAHMAIALLGAKILSENRPLFKCNVRFIFQPAEEVPPGGAVEMVRSGCLEGVDEVYGLHNDILNDVGVVTANVGPMTASVGIFDLLLKGRGGHAGMPCCALDPIKAACDLIGRWYKELEALKSSLSPFTFRVTRLVSGNTYNVIPEEAFLAGTIRTFADEDFYVVANKLKETLAFFESSGLESVFDCKKCYSATMNSEAEVEKVIAAAEQIVGGSKIIKSSPPSLCGEDFSYYQQKKPGVFFFLGTRNISKKIFEPHHSPRFDIDEEAIALGAAIMVQLAHQM